MGSFGSKPLLSRFVLVGVNPSVKAAPDAAAPFGVVPPFADMALGGVSGLVDVPVIIALGPAVSIMEAGEGRLLADKPRCNPPFESPLAAAVGWANGGMESLPESSPVTGLGVPIISAASLGDRSRAKLFRSI